jgi:hypothetical protein
MQKKIWIIGGIVLLLLIAGIVTVLYLKGDPRIKDLNAFILPASPKPVQDSEIIITGKDDVTSILPNTEYKGRMPFYLDENHAWDDNFYFMFYYSDRKSIFYSFDTSQSDTEELYQKEFEVNANVESGEVVNEGQGLVYRDIVNDSYTEGSLRYLKKEGAAVTILRNCIYYSVSPDKKRVIAGGNDPKDSEQDEKQFYIYDFAKEKLFRLDQVFCPQSLEDLVGVEALWNHNSRYVCLIDKVIDAESGGVIKKDFSGGDTILTSFRWSPDGQRLAFLSQSGSNSNYSIDLENISICLSDRVGIYNTWDGSVRYIAIRDGLAVDYIWADDSKSIVVKSVSLENADAFISNYQPESNTAANPEKFDLFQIDIDKQVLTEFFQDAPVRSIHQFFEGKLLYVYLKNGTSYIAVYDTKSKTTQNLFGGSTLTSYRYQNKLIIAVPQGVYRLTDKLKTVKLLAWDQNYPLVLFPEREIAVLKKHDRIEVVSLKGKL